MDKKLSIVGMHSAKDIAKISFKTVWDNKNNFFKIEENVSSDDEKREENCEMAIKEKTHNLKTVAANSTNLEISSKAQIPFRLTPNTASIPVVTQSQVLLKGEKDQFILHSSKSSICGPVLMKDIHGIQPCVLPLPNVNVRPMASHLNTNILKSQVVYLNQGIPAQPTLIKSTFPTSHFEEKSSQSVKNNNTTILIPETSTATCVQPSSVPVFPVVNNTSQNSTKSLFIPPLSSSQPPLQPKPGQILLQTADGQKLLLQPIQSNLNNTQLKQGVITPLLANKKTCSQPLINNINTNISKPTVFESNPNAGKVIFLSNPPPISISTRATSITPKQINDSTSLQDQKPALMNILTEEKKKLSDSSISENIEVLEVSNSNFAGEKIEWVEKCSRKNQVPNRQTFKKKKNDDIYFSKLSGNKKSGAEDVACFLPLQVCGSATLEHLISLTENKTVKDSELNHVPEKNHINTDFHDTPKQPCVSRLLKDTLKDFQTKPPSGGSRRKQILTNRTAEAEQSFTKISQKYNYPAKKNRRHLINRKTTSTVESDEIISSISDFDLVGENIDVALDKSFSHLDAYQPGAHSSTDTLDLKISDVCSLKIEDDCRDMAFCSSPTSQSMKRNCDTDDNLVNIKRIKTELETSGIKIKSEPGNPSEPFKVGQILSSDDLVRRSYRIFSKPSFQCGNISTETVLSNTKEFIPITNVLNAKLELDKNTEMEIDTLSRNAPNPEAPFDYSSLKGPVSINLSSVNKKSVKKYMGLKSCYVKLLSDFNIIDSKFAINGLRKVYSCNHCKGEYATVNIKSLAEHIEMHKKFPKLHMLVQERPYEVTAVPGKELSCMISDSKVLSGNDSLSSAEKNRNKKHFCVLCPYYARSPLTLKSHRNVHSLTSKVTCDICGIVYRNSKVLEMHKTNEHKSELKKMVYISARPL